VKVAAAALLVAAVVTGLAISVHFDLVWLRLCSIVVAVVGGALGAMLAKSRRSRPNRADRAGSRPRP